MISRAPPRSSSSASQHIPSPTPPGALSCLVADTDGTNGTEISAESTRAKHTCTGRGQPAANRWRHERPATRLCSCRSETGAWRLARARLDLGLQERAPESPQRKGQSPRPWSYIQPGSSQ
eukprot:scaffold30632_cov112-Isochrysis_galbana.AAC.3